jgi:hypothetical protein
MTHASGRGRISCNRLTSVPDVGPTSEGVDAARADAKVRGRGEMANRKGKLLRRGYRRPLRSPLGISRQTGEPSSMVV